MTPLAVRWTEMAAQELIREINSRVGVEQDKVLVVRIADHSLSIRKPTGYFMREIRYNGSVPKEPL